MANSCRLSPVVFRRNGTKMEEKDSKLFKDIKKAVQDNDTAWRMWAFTKTTEFKNNYKEVEYDELGEVTFPSLLKVLHLESTYNDQKSIEDITEDYGFKNTVFNNPEAAISKVNDFNSKEKKFVSILHKIDNGYTIEVLPRIAENVERAREQSYNNALTKEIIELLNTIGFDVSWVANPKYEGLFDPENATLHNGLLQIIKLAQGEVGENALPEEFSHLIIEGLINHPLVQRLLNSLDDSQIQDILGNQYEDYVTQYDNDVVKMKKEAAGKLLAQYITQQGKIKPQVVNQKKGLLSRIWNWAKGLFSKITGRQLSNARKRATDAILDIYQLVSSGEVLPLIDKDSIIKSSDLYRLREEFNNLDKMAHAAVAIAAKRYKMEQQRSGNGKASKITRENLKKAQQQLENAQEFESIVTVLNDAKRQITDIQTKVRTIEREQAINGNLTDIREINQVGKVVREIEEFIGGYNDLIKAIATLDNSDNALQLGLHANEREAENLGKALANVANECNKILNYLSEFVGTTKRNIVTAAARTVYTEDRVRGIGSKRNEIMSLATIIDHADRDINFVDRWLTAMSDADDPFLTIIDRLVKQQKYERDMEMIEWNARIADADEKLRKAGYSSEFMLEKNDKGVPTGRIISEYDFDTFNAEYREYAKHLREDLKLEDTQYYEMLSKWKKGSVKVNGKYKNRVIRVYVDEAIQERYKMGELSDAEKDAYVYDEMPNPAIYSKNKDRIENLPAAQKEYYNKMLQIKRQMMTRIPKRGQGIYKAIYISKDLVEGVLDNSTSSPLKALKEEYKKKYIRRPDDIGFGASENFPDDVKAIIEKEDDTMKAAEEIIKTLADATDDNVLVAVDPKDLKKIIEKNRDNSKKAAEEVIEAIASENFYEVDTDFANRRIQRLPIYYTRRLRDMRMLSTDFSGCMVAYCAMATNYAKMNEVIDILEVTRDYAKERKLIESEGDTPLKTKITALGKVYKSFVTRIGAETNAAGRIDDYYKSVVYEERKNDEGSKNILGTQIDVAKALDTIKDYTGLIGLGFNLFSTISNLTVGKIQQWIEAWGGEYFTFKDYAKAIAQYTELMPGCLAEMNSPVKKNKLSLLIQMFDPMGEQFESYRNSNFNKNPLVRILGSSALAYIGMNAGEHVLHCQTMLAILNNIKVIDPSTNKKISLYDALEVEEGEDGISRLVFKKDYAYEKELIDTNTGSLQKDKITNKNYGKPLKDENGKIKTEQVPLEWGTRITDNYIMRQKRRIRKVNDSLNGAFGADEKGAAHLWALFRIILQYRQWMPGHYQRRFARAHYDSDLEQWREGYYVTTYKIRTQMLVDLFKGKLEYAKLRNSLSEHEKANLRRANAEITMFFTLMALCKFGGRVKDRDRSWLEKMLLYQMHRMYLETGASMPFNGDFFDNILQILQKPAAAIDTFKKYERVLHLENMFDEVQTGRYQGWSELGRDAFKLLPGADQIWKAVYFDDGMFSMFEKNKNN